MLAAVLVGSTGICGCLVDSNSRCGKGQEYDEELRYCVCADGYAFNNAGCQKCAKHELGTISGCICKVGYARTSGSGACEKVSTEAGAPCTSDAECANPDYPHCHLDPTGGYCTNQGCTSDEDCAATYACEVGGDPPYCRRAPTGTDVPCESDADCTALEASFCDQFVTHHCLVRDCTMTPDNCFRGTECCDLASFGLPALCVAEGACQE